MKVIITKSTNLITAQFAINNSKKIPTTTLVLEQIINLANNPILIRDLAPTITPILNISPEAFRKAIHTLYKLKIISKVGHAIILNQSLLPSDKILFKQIT